MARVGDRQGEPYADAVVRHQASGKVRGGEGREVLSRIRPRGSKTGCRMTSSAIDDGGTYLQTARISATSMNQDPLTENRS